MTDEVHHSSMERVDHMKHTAFPVYFYPLTPETAELRQMLPDVKGCRHLQELFKICDRQAKPLVILHAKYLDDDAVAAIREWISEGHDAKIILLANQEVLLHALELMAVFSASIMLPDSGWQEDNEMDHWLAWAQIGRADQALEDYLGPDGTYHHYSIHTMNDKESAIEMLVNIFCMLDLPKMEIYDSHLIFEELVNNAMFHAYRLANGQKKYVLDTFKSLEPQEHVKVTIGWYDKILGFSVTDSSGLLSRELVIEKIRRQLNAFGLLEENGRGLYLSYILSHRLIFDITPNVSTKVTTLFKPIATQISSERPPQPLFIFQTPK